MIKKFEEFINESYSNFNDFEKANMQFVCDLFASNSEHDSYNRGSDENGEEPILCIYFYPKEISEIVRGIEFVDYEYGDAIEADRINEIEIDVRPEQGAVYERFNVLFNYSDEELGVGYAKPKNLKDLIEISNRFHNLHKKDEMNLEVEGNENYEKHTRSQIMQCTNDIFDDGANIWATKDNENNIVLHIRGKFKNAKEFAIYPFERKISDMFMIKSF